MTRTRRPRRGAAPGACRRGRSGAAPAARPSKPPGMRQRGAASCGEHRVRPPPVARPRPGRGDQRRPRPRAGPSAATRDRQLDRAAAAAARGAAPTTPAAGARQATGAAGQRDDGVLDVARRRSSRCTAVVPSPSRTAVCAEPVRRPGATPAGDVRRPRRRARRSGTASTSRSGRPSTTATPPRTPPTPAPARTSAGVGRQRRAVAHVTRPPAARTPLSRAPGVVHLGQHAAHHGRPLTSLIQSSGLTVIRCASTDGRDRLDVLGHHVVAAGDRRRTPGRSASAPAPRAARRPSAPAGARGWPAASATQ